MRSLIDDSSIISVNASVISSNRIISAKDVQRTGWVSLSVRGVEQPYPSATFSGPAEILTKDIGERTARITQRIAGMDEPPSPRATKRWLKSTA